MEFLELKRKIYVLSETVETKIVDLFKTNNFALLRFFVFHILLLKKIEFWIFNSIFLN